MKMIKDIASACMILLTPVAGKCFVVISFDSDDDQDGLTIVGTNAETIGNEVVPSLTQILTVADIASQSAQYINDAVMSDPPSYSCDNTSGVVMLTVNVLDQSNRISVGDDLSLRYTNCSADNVITNGDLKKSYSMQKESTSAILKAAQIGYLHWTSMQAPLKSAQEIKCLS